MTSKPGTIHEAPGAPGGPPRWTHGMKTGAGTSRSDTSLVWFTIGRGVLSEVFYPRIDSPCMRDACFIVTAKDGFFSDERADTDHTVTWLEDGIPAFHAVTTCKSGRYRIEKTYVTDDRLNTVLQRSKFVVLSGDISDYRLFIYVNPHVYGKGLENTAWVEDFKGKRVLFLSVPWGEHRGDEDLLQGAYHLVWPRDLVNHATGLLAAGDVEHAKDIVGYLRNTQEDDGHWPQNMWVAGSAFWTGIQLDQTAQPILLADLMLREDALSTVEQKRFWPMVRKAAQFLVSYGPATELDRWEEKGGYTAYTLSTMIAALLAAAEWADTMGESSVAIGLREIADSWNERIDGWMYVRGTSLAARLGVDGYFARILPKERVFSPSLGDSEVKLLPKKSDEEDDESELPPEEVVSVDALTLVRYGLRRGDDPRILNTVRAIDALLLTENAQGPVWHRYNGDEFGEHDDGRPFSTDDKGKGRGWPLLIGERAHYELLRGASVTGICFDIGTPESGRRAPLQRTYPYVMPTGRPMVSLMAAASGRALFSVL